MTGLSTYSAQNLLNYITGQTAEPALPSVFLALFTASGNDDGTGFTEVAGGSYARMQIGGNGTTNAATATGNNVLHFAVTPAWVTPGMTAYDATANTVIPLGMTVLSVTGNTAVLSANVTGAGVGSGDIINFSAFGRATATSPASISNVATINFPAATAGWGTIVSFGLYDAATVGNLLQWDWLGPANWIPATITSASPGVFTAEGSAYTNGDPVIYSIEYGGTAPTGLTPGNTILTVAGATSDTFNVGVNTTSPGSGNVRKIVQQAIPTGVTATFGPNALNTLAA